MANGEGIPDVTMIQYIESWRMLGAWSHRYFKSTIDEIIYDRNTHRFKECPHTKGLRKDDAHISYVNKENQAPFRACRDCYNFYRSIIKEIRRRKIDSGYYEEFNPPQDELKHKECGRTEDRCGCFDI